MRLIRKASRITRDVSMSLAFRIRCRFRGVHISNNTRVIACRGIVVGRGTRVDRGATISAGEVGCWHGAGDCPSGSVHIGEYCEVHTGAIVAAYGGHIHVGDRVSVNPYTILYGHGGLHIGDNTLIAAHVTVIPANHVFGDHALIREQGLTTRGIRIGHDVWIGTGVRILDGVTIGSRAVVAAGAVVTRNVEEGDVVVGVPAKPIRNRFSKLELRATL